MYPRRGMPGMLNPRLQRGFGAAYEEPILNWEDGFNPMYEQFNDPYLNSYASGPGLFLPPEQQPFNSRYAHKL